MPAKSTITGIVLKSALYGEHDRLLTLLTKESGRMTVTAKGAQSMRCTYLSCCQSFALCEFVVSRSARTGYFYVDSARLINGFGELSKDLSRLACASYCTELADAAAGSESERLLYSLLEYALYFTSKAVGDRILLCALTFALKAAAVAGSAPQLERCVECASQDQAYALVPSRGGLVCRDCMPLVADATGAPMLRSVEASLMARLTYLPLKGLVEVPAIDRDEIMPLLRACDSYLCFLYARKFKSFAML